MFKAVVAEIFGFFVLLPACLLYAWGPTQNSIKPWPSGAVGKGPYRPWCDSWCWSWLNSWYNNVEDGVSGQQAWIWTPAGALVSYPSTFPSWVPRWVIAYAWSAWRNGANNVRRPLNPSVPQ